MLKEPVCLATVRIHWASLQFVSEQEIIIKCMLKYSKSQTLPCVTRVIMPQVLMISLLSLHECIPDTYEDTSLTKRTWLLLVSTAVTTIDVLHAATRVAFA